MTIFFQCSVPGKTLPSRNGDSESGSEALVLIFFLNVYVVIIASSDFAIRTKLSLANAASYFLNHILLHFAYTWIIELIKVAS